MKKLKDKEKEVIWGILEYLKNQSAQNLCFKFNEEVIDFLQKKGIPPKKLFGENCKGYGEIVNLSIDGMMYIVLTNGEDLIVPMRYLEDVSLHEKG